MAGDGQIGQDEIEELLRQAQMAARGTSTPSTPNNPPAQNNPAPPPATEPNGMLGQDEIEALLKGGSPPASKPAPAAPVAPPAKKPATTPVPTPTQGDDISLLLAQAEAALASVDQPVERAPPGIAPFPLSELSGSPASTENVTLELLRDVELDLRIELGRTQMQLEEVLKLRRGSVVALDKLAGDPVDVYVNGRLIARGEVLVLNDNFCVRVAELLAGDERGAA